MSTSIQLLSEETINQIAAGEVIENPASVIKELVENSLDAKASQITIEVEEGGFQLIRVSDNGMGMSEQDLKLCIERHATSKIRQAKDLEAIFSMGFRGEALSSIASISKITLTTSLGNEGQSLYAEGGAIHACALKARTRGTTIEVHSLFFNVPARKKFQKSPLSSQNALLKMVTKLALAHPEVEIRCICDKTEKFSTFMNRSSERQEMFKQVAEKVLGEAFFDEALPIHHKSEECEITGFIGAPHQSRAHRTGQFLVVNRRVIDSPELLRAIYEGYGTTLKAHAHPTFFLHVTLPLAWIDVNVHPQKKEIRLHEKNLAEQFVQRGVRKAFQKIALPSKSTTQFESFEVEENWMQETAPLFKCKEEETTAPTHFFSDHLPAIGLYAHYLLIDSSHAPFVLKEEPGVIWIDLEAAEARLFFEAFLSRFTDQGAMQNLLFPVTFEVSVEEEGQIEPHLQLLEKLGVAARSFGKQTFVVDALDPHLDEEQIAPLVRELVTVLERFDDPLHLEKKEQKKLALHLMRYVRSKEEEYHSENAQMIVKELLKSENPFHSPTGQPICIHMSQNEIKKAFS